MTVQTETPARDTSPRGANQAPHARGRDTPPAPLIDRLALPLAISLLLILSVPRLPPDVCFHDAGDLQVAAATLGIAHPPGYAGYVSIGYLLTHTPGVSPAYAISLACLGAGLTALALCALLQMRLGVNAWIAAALITVLAAHPRFWVNLIAPEVYAPSLAFEAGAAYLLLKYARLGATARRRDLLAAALLLGIALANRPPIALAIPGFAAALWIAWRRYPAPARGRIRNALLAVGCLLMPCVYSAAYVWVRDAASTPCNYIERYRAGAETLPPATAGIRAKAERLVWLASGRQFEGLLGNARTDIPGRLRWMIEQLGLKHDAAFLLAAVVLAFGVVLTNRRSPAYTALFVGIALATTVFVCFYRVYDAAADMLPLLFVLTVFAGAAAAPVFPARIGWPRRTLAICLFAGVCVWVVIDVPRRPNAAAAADATGFLRSVGVPTLPAGATILTTWHQSPPLLYAQHIQASRRDIEVVTASPSHWVSLARRRTRPSEPRPGPVYLPAPIPVPAGVTLTPFRSLWQIEFTGSQFTTDD